MSSNLLTLYKKDTQQNFLSRFIFSGFHLLFPLDRIISKLAVFDQQIDEKGHQQALTNFFDFLKVEVEVKNLTGLRKKNSYLIFGNHPTFLDPLVIWFALKTKNIKLIIEQNALKIGPHFSSHIIPIKYIQTLNGKIRHTSWTTRLSYSFFKSLAEPTERQEAVKFNLRQINTAGRFLAQSGNLLVFPYTTLNKKKISKGIGFILAKAMTKPRNRPIKILPFFIAVKPSNFWHLKAMFRFTKNIGLKIYFGEEIDAGELKNLVNQPKKTTTRLDQIYKDFIGQLWKSNI